MYRQTQKQSVAVLPACSRALCALSAPCCRAMELVTTSWVFSGNGWTLLKVRASEWLSEQFHKTMTRTNDV